VSAQGRDFAAVVATGQARGASGLIGLYPAGCERSALLPILHAFQNVEGWVSPEAMARAGEWVGVPRLGRRVDGVVLHAVFRRPVGRTCCSRAAILSCIINGAGEIMAHFRERLGVGHNQTTADGFFSYEEASVWRRAIGRRACK
jgi:NADH-quinone oxidoreductase subunit E